MAGARPDLFKWKRQSKPAVNNLTISFRHSGHQTADLVFA